MQYFHCLSSKTLQNNLGGGGRCCYNTQCVRICRCLYGKCIAQVSYPQRKGAHSEAQFYKAATTQNCPVGSKFQGQHLSLHGMFIFVGSFSAFAAWTVNFFSSNLSSICLFVCSSLFCSSVLLSVSCHVHNLVGPIYFKFRFISLFRI